MFFMENILPTFGIVIVPVFITQTRWSPSEVNHWRAIKSHRCGGEFAEVQFHSFLTTRVANQNTEFTASCPLTELAIY